MYHSLDKRIWFPIIFLLLEESHSEPDMDFFFYYTFTYFFPIEVIDDRVIKIKSKQFYTKFGLFHLSR